MQQKLDEYDAQYNANLDILELNYNINIKSDELEGLEPGTDEYYRKENEIRQLQVDYYTNKGNLTEEEKEFLQFQKDYIQVNKYYIAGDEDKARAMKTQMIDPMTGQCVATDAEIEYENADWWGRTCINAKTVGATFVTSMAGAGETIIDGGVMLTAGTVGLFDDDVAQWTEDFVSVNWTDDAYDGLVASGGLNEYSAYSGYHTVTDFLTTTGTYVGLSFIPGVGGSAVMALSAAGSSGQTALDNGATLKEAVGTSWVAGGLAFAADFGLDKLNAAEGVTQALKVTGRTAIGVGEPALNTIAEYAIYGHENSENIFDYAEKTGAYTNIAIGGLVTNIAGAYGDYKKAQLNQYKVDFNAKMDSMTDAQRSQSWADYYSGKYGDANVDHSSGIGIDGHNGSFVDPDANLHNTFNEIYLFGDHVSGRGIDGSNGSFVDLDAELHNTFNEIYLFGEHTSGRGIDGNLALAAEGKAYIDRVVASKMDNARWDYAKQQYELKHGADSFWDLTDAQRGQLKAQVDITQDSFKLKQKEFEQIAQDTIDSISDLKSKGMIKPEYSVKDVLAMIEQGVPQETYLTDKAVIEWKQSWSPDSNGDVEVYCFQDSSNSYALKNGTIGRPPTPGSTSINPAGDGGAFVMTKSQYESLLANRNIFDADGNCIDVAALGEALGGVKFYGSPISIKQTVPLSSVEMPMGNNQGSFLGDWRPGGKTSGGVIEGVVPQNFTDTSTSGSILSGTTVEIIKH